MFQLALITDTIKVPPSSFNRDQIEVLTEEIDRKYSNRVVMDVGLGVCLYDFVDVGDAYLYPSDGSAHHRVTFRMMVFRPFVGEILVGKVAQCNENGIRVSLGFFDDITIPSYLLQTPSEFDAREKVWVWTYNSDEAGEPAVRYLMEVDEPIRFRVRSINFTHLKHTAKGLQATTTSMEAGTAEGLLASTAASMAGARRQRSDSLVLTDTTTPPAPMQIVATTNEDGLGMTSWWG